MNQHFEQSQVADCINRLFIMIDNKSWEKVKTCFAEEVKFDMTSMGEDTVRYMNPQEIVDTWDISLNDIKYLHHQSGNFIINIQREDATAFCYGIAYHFNSAEDFKMFVGSYEFELKSAGDAWKISSIKFNLKFIKEG